MKLFSLFLTGGALLAQGTALWGQASQQPNIIWITCEDISPYMSVYGDRVVSTPNIDRLASEGMRFQSVYTTAGVSAHVSHVDRHTTHAYVDRESRS